MSYKRAGSESVQLCEALCSFTTLQEVFRMRRPRSPRCSPESRAPSVAFLRLPLLAQNPRKLSSKSSTALSLHHNSLTAMASITSALPNACQSLFEAKTKSGTFSSLPVLDHAHCCCRCWC